MPTHFKGTPAQKNALNAYIKFSRASSALETYMRRTLNEKGLTPSQLGVLEAIHHLGPLNQKELADKMLMSGGNVTHVIDNLEKAGMAKRAPGSDRRTFKIMLTPKGSRYISRLMPEHVADITRAMSALNAGELKTLGELCKKLGFGIGAIENADA